MLRRQPVFLVAAIVFAVDVYAANSWSVVHCNPVDAAEATGIRILNEGGTELFRVCQDGSLLPQTGFTNVTGDQDFLFVTQVGAKAREATLYRRSGAHYIRVGWWSGWDIRTEEWQNRPAIHYEELEPRAERPKSVVYFTWDGNRLVPNRSTPMIASINRRFDVRPTVVCVNSPCVTPDPKQRQTQDYKHEGDITPAIRRVSWCTTSTQSRSV